MQTKINVKQAFGLVGELYDLTPYRVDAKEVKDTDGVSFGGLCGLDSSGNVGTMSSTYSTYRGVFVRPKEAISYGTSNAPLAATMTIPQGSIAQIAAMGRVVMALEVTATHTVATSSYVQKTEEDAALAAMAALTTTVDYGDTAYVYNYKLSTDSSGTAIGKFVVGGANKDAAANAVTYSAAASGNNTVTTATGYILVVVELG